MANDWIDVPTAIHGHDLATNRDEFNRAFDWFKSLQGARASLYFPVGIHPVMFLEGESLVLPPTIHLVFEPGAILQLRQVDRNGDEPSPLRAATVLLTILGHVEAGLHQIFDVMETVHLRLGAPARVHGQVWGPRGNEVLYPQWWGAQEMEPQRVAWNLPHPTVTPPVGLGGGEYGHMESVDSIAVQMCLNAARDGQTVRFAGDFDIAYVDLAHRLGTQAGARRAGNNLILEGNGGTLRAPRLSAFPSLDLQSRVTLIPETLVTLPKEQLFVLIVNRLQAAYDYHLRGEAVGGTRARARLRHHLEGNEVAFRQFVQTGVDSNGVVSYANFANFLAFGPQYQIYNVGDDGELTVDGDGAWAVLLAWVAAFNDHLNAGTDVALGEMNPPTHFASHQRPNCVPSASVRRPKKSARSAPLAGRGGVKAHDGAARQCRRSWSG